MIISIIIIILSQVAIIAACPTMKYRLICVKFKGVILQFAWTMFLCAGYTVAASVTLFLLQQRSLLFEISINISVLFMLTFPIIGLVAGSCLGRYKVIVASIYITMGSVIFRAIAFSLPASASMASTMLYIVGLATSRLGNAAFMCISLPYTIEQIVGVTSDELAECNYLLVALEQ